MILTKKGILHFLIFMLLVTTFLPIVYHNLPFPLRSFKFFWGPLWLVAFFFLTPRYVASKLVLYLLVYLFFMVIFFPIVVWFNADKWYLNINVYNESYVYAIGITVYSYLFSEKDFHYMAKLSRIILFFIFITVIMTLISTYLDPMYARYLAGGSGYDINSSKGMMFNRIGGALYSYGQAFSLIFPILIYHYKIIKNNILRKRFLLLFISLLYLAVIQMQFFANIIVATVVIVISFFGLKNLKYSIGLIGVLLIAISLIPTDVYANFFLYLSSFFDTGSQNHFKLVDMATFIDTGVVDEGTGAGSRMSRYPELLEAFINSPLFGNFARNKPFSINAAFHLYLGAKIAALGLIAFLFFMRLHFIFIRMNYRFFNNSSYLFYYTVSLGGFLLLALMKQVTGREVWLTYFVVLPILYFMPYINKQISYER